METLLTSNKETVAKNNYYEIAIDSVKNRAYIKIIGFWRNPQEAGNYIKDLHRGLRCLQGRFTLLTDLTEMKTHPVEVQSVHLQAQRLLLTKGLLQTAEVYASSFIQFQTNNLSKQSKMPLKQFTSIEAAENYLDSIETT
jgi:hypothetical protein